MAESVGSLSSSPYASSIHSQLSDDPLSSILADSDAEEGDSDISIDEEGVESEEEDEEDSNYGQEEEEEEDADEDEDMNQEDNYDDGDSDDFDLARHNYMDEFDFDAFAFPGEAEPAGYLDFRQEEDPFVPHALIYQLQNHLAQEQWGVHHHSPPPMDQHRARPGAQPGIQGDQLVEVEMVGQRSANGGQQRQRQRDPDVIDLTGDDDVAMPDQANSGPPHRPAPAGLQRPSENQRRLRSQPQNAPPRLNRSDGNYVDDQHVIVLSSSDDEELPLRASPGRNTRRNAHNNNNGHRNMNNRAPNNGRGNPLPNGRIRIPRLGEQPQQPGSASASVPAPAQARDMFRPLTQMVQNFPLFQFLSNHQYHGMANRDHNHNHDDDELVITAERNLANSPDAGHFLGINMGPIRLDYAAGQAFPIPVPPAPPAAGPRKPAHVPPTPARPGFTRDTGEDVVAICPSCDQELAYDPEGDDENPPTRPKKPRSKKASAEHHFWAVKACGHVRYSSYSSPVFHMTL